MKKDKEISENTSDSKLLFGKRNYTAMIIGIFLIAMGFLLMMGADANTRPDGVFDPNYWNQDIFSWRRIRLAPFLIISGFVLQVYAILTKSTSDE